MGEYQDDNRTCGGVVEFQLEMQIIFVGRFDLRLCKIWLFNVAVHQTAPPEMYKILNRRTELLIVLIIIPFASPRSCPDSCAVPNIHFRALTD